MTIGKKLQARRKEMNLTQGEVAERLFVSRQAISNWELDKNYPDLETVIALSDLYGLSLDVLLKEDQNVVKGIAKTMNRKIWGALFYGGIALSGLVCLIVDFALNRSLTWSLIPLLSLAFLAACAIVFGRRNGWPLATQVGSYVVLTLAFLGLLDRALLALGYIQETFFLPVALPVSLLWLALIAVTVVLHLKRKQNIFHSFSLFSALAIPGGIATNLIVSSEPIWIGLLTNGLPCLLLAILFFVLGNSRTKEKKR